MAVRKFVVTSGRLFVGFSVAEEEDHIVGIRGAPSRKRLSLGVVRGI